MVLHYCPINHLSTFLKNNWAISDLFSLFSSFQFWLQLIVNNIADEWIQTAELRCRKRLLYQLWHNNHCQFFQLFRCANENSEIKRGRFIFDARINFCCWKKSEINFCVLLKIYIFYAGWGWNQCDQIARVVLQHLAIYNDDNLPQIIEILAKFIQIFAKYQI